MFFAKDHREVGKSPMYWAHIRRRFFGICPTELRVKVKLKRLTKSQLANLLGILFDQILSKHQKKMPADPKVIIKRLQEWGSCDVRLEKSI